MKPGWINAISDWFKEHWDWVAIIAIMAGATIFFIYLAFTNIPPPPPGY